MTTTNDWRGVAAEDHDDLPTKASLILKERSRRLLGELVRPHKRIIGLLFIAVLIENAARLSVPYLVKEGIDKGIPPIVEGEGNRTLLTVVAILLVAVVVQAVTRQIFLTLAGRIGQEVLRTLRRRMFAHFHVLWLPFTRTTPPAASSHGRPQTSTRSTSCWRPASTA